MAGNNMNRGGGGAVYHWKHGWIPRTPQAALQKAHGSRKGADKLMSKHGIPGKPAGGRDNNIGVLEVRKADKGFEVVHKPSGLRLTQHSTKGVAEAAREKHASTPENLNVSADELRNNKAAMEHLQGVSRDSYTAEGDRKREASMVAAAKRQRPARAQKVNNPAKSGDLVVVSREQSSWTNGKRSVTEEHIPGVVTHVHSDGTPIAYRDAGGSFRTVGPRDETRVMPQDEIDVQGVLGRVKDTNKWSGGQPKNSYDSLDAVQSAARSFRKDKPKASTAGAADSAKAASLREAAAKKRAEADRIANGAGVNDRAAAMLSGRTHTRQVARDDAALRRFSETRRQAEALEAQARSAEGRVARVQEKQRAADLNLKPSDVGAGDLVVVNGMPTLVSKVNKTTVSVPSGVGGSWDDNVPLSKVSRHIKVADLKDANLKVLHAKARGKAKDALTVEMQRRGLIDPPAPERSFSDRLRNGTLAEKVEALREAQMPVTDRRKKAAASATVNGNKVTYRGAQIGSVQKLGSLWYDGSGRHFKTKTEAVGALVLAHRP